LRDAFDVFLRPLSAVFHDLVGAFSLVSFARETETLPMGFLCVADGEGAGLCPSVRHAAPSGSLRNELRAAIRGSGWPRCCWSLSRSQTQLLQILVVRPLQSQKEAVRRRGPWYPSIGQGLIVDGQGSLVISTFVVINQNFMLGRVYVPAKAAICSLRVC